MAKLYLENNSIKQPLILMKELKTQAGEHWPEFFPSFKKDFLLDSGKVQVNTNSSNEVSKCVNTQSEKQDTKTQIKVELNTNNISSSHSFFKPEDKEEGEESIPNAFICPISQEIMSEPVVADDGNTYERLEIEGWLKSHNTSPITRERMSDKLTFNRNLKDLIDEYKKKQTVSMNV